MSQLSERLCQIYFHPAFERKKGSEYDLTMKLRLHVFNLSNFFWYRTVLWIRSFSCPLFPQSTMFDGRLHWCSSSLRLILNLFNGSSSLSLSIELSSDEVDVEGDRFLFLYFCLLIFLLPCFLQGISQPILKKKTTLFTVCAKNLSHTKEHRL